MPDLPTEGDNITFMIGNCFPPGQASSPSPANGATSISITPTLSWTAGGGALSHDVYFGTSTTPPFIHNQAGTSYNPGTLSCNTQYYWRIDEVGVQCKTTGVVWSFTTAGCPPLTQWRSVKTHSICGEMSIVLDPTATGTTSTKPTVETRGTTAATQGVLKVQIDFGGPMTLADTSKIAVTYRPTIQGTTPTIGSPSSVTPSSVTMADADTLSITFAAGALPNLGCVNITLLAGLFSQTITGDLDCNIRCLAGDVNSSGTLTSADMLATKAQVSLGWTCASDPKYDFNLSGSVTSADMLFAKSQVITPAKTALCP
jgi:hypothetical protein